MGPIDSSIVSTTKGWSRRWDSLYRNYIRALEPAIKLSIPTEERNVRQNNAQARGTGERNASSDVTLVLATEFQCTQSSGPLITTSCSFVTTITVPVDKLTKHRGLVSKCFPFHAYLLTTLKKVHSKKKPKSPTLPCSSWENRPTRYIRFCEL